MADDQQFCLKWTNHQNTLIQNFDRLLESDKLVDCTLAAEGKYLKAHKVVLYACSPYFQGLLNEHYDKHPIFILSDVKFNELRAIMDYMYKGEVNISQDKLAALLKVAESLQIKGLAENSPQETIPHMSSVQTIEKSKVPKQGMAHGPVGDLPKDSASAQIPMGLSSREGSQSPSAKRRRKIRRRNMGEDGTIENHDTSNSNDMTQDMGVPALGIAPVADEKAHAAGPTDSIGRSALMTQLTKPADETLQLPLERPVPSDGLIEPKSEYLEDPEENVEDLTLDDDMNDLNEMEQDANRAGPSHDPSQQAAGRGAWHRTDDRSNAAGVVSSVAGASGTTDEVFLAAQEAAQAHRDSQDANYSSTNWTVPTLPPTVTSTPVASCTRRLRSFSMSTKDDQARIPDSHRVVGGSWRKYRCNDCEESFPLAATLTRHRMYECEKGKFVATERHARLPPEAPFVQGRLRGKRYTCPDCNRVYALLTSVWRHRKYECGVEPKFTCPICKFKFSQKGNLVRHVRTKH